MTTIKLWEAKEKAQSEKEAIMESELQEVKRQCKDIAADKEKVVQQLSQELESLKSNFFVKLEKREKQLLEVRL